jgi:hypothetical protein
MGMDDEDMERSMTSLLAEGETILEDVATEEGRMWNSMSAISSDLDRPSQFLPLLPSGKSKMSHRSNAPSPKVRALNRPEDWLASGRKNTYRSWKPKLISADNKPGEDISLDFAEDAIEECSHNNSSQSFPMVSGGKTKGNNSRVPVVIRQKEWATPVTEKPKLSLNSSAHSILIENSKSPKSTAKTTIAIGDSSMHSNASGDSKSRISGARNMFERQISMNSMNDIGSPVSSRKSPARNTLQKRSLKTPPSTVSPFTPSSDGSIQLVNAPDLDEDDDANGAASKKGQDASSTPGLLDMAMERMEDSMTSFAVEDDVATESTAKSVIDMWNSMSVINTKPSLDVDVQNKASKGSKVKWSFKDADKKKKAPAPLNENESDESKSKPQEKKTIKDKTPQENPPDLEASLTSVGSHDEFAEPTDNDISRFSKSMSCLEPDKPDEFLPLRPKYRANKASVVQHKIIAHNRPDDWLGPCAGSKPAKRSWTVKKVVEVSEMGDDDDSGDESDKEKEAVAATT